MGFTHSTFVADVAVIYGSGEVQSYGSGRLVAPGLVLTAAHVIHENDGSIGLTREWNVLLFCDPGHGSGGDRSPLKAKVVWTGKDGLDLAMLQVLSPSATESVPTPRIQPIYASFDELSALEVHATGFPEAWRDEGKTRDLTVSGMLRVTSRNGPYTWNTALRPDRRDGWRGMSGAAICFPTEDGRLYLFGVVQQVPANFSQGILEIARASSAIADKAFCDLLENATGNVAPFALITDQGAVTSSASACIGTLRSRFPALVEGTVGNFRIKLEAFLSEYLLSSSAPLKFLGRDDELAHLDAWLSGGKSSAYLALVGPAGRGKSALVTQWAARVAERGKHDVVLLPISVRFDLNRPNELLKLLAFRLGYLAGKRTELESSPEHLIDEIHGILTSDRSPTSRGLLVVIDGWDEAQDPSWLHLPHQLGEGVQIVVCSRLLVGEIGVQDALHRIGISASAAPLLLPSLSKRDLIEGSRSLEEWIPGVGDWLWRHSEGDPLLVHLYLDWISDHKDSGESLANLAPDSEEVGLARYMRMWWTEAQSTAGETGSEHVRRLLYALAVALGPLSSEELADITELEPLDVSYARVPLRRLLVGDGRKMGYAFSHPRIAQFVIEELMTARSCADMEERYLVQCRDVAHSLNRDPSTRKPVSRYFLSFCVDHFEKHGATLADYAALLTSGWMHARHTLDGHYSGLVSDLLRVRAIAWKADAMELGAACAIARATVVTLSSGIPAELLRMAVDAGFISGIQVVEEIRTVSSSRARAVALSAVAESLDESAALRAVEIAWNLSQQEDRLLALAALSGRLTSTRDALAADLNSEPCGTVIELLLLRTAFAKLGYGQLESLTIDQERQLDEELRRRIWGVSRLEEYIQWASEIANVIAGESREIFVKWVAHSVNHRDYKWKEFDFAERLVRSISQYVSLEALEELNTLLTESSQSSEEGRAYVLARRIVGGKVKRRAEAMRDLLQVSNPWTCIPLLPHMNRETAQWWARKCLSASAKHVPNVRWQDIFKCLPYAGNSEFVKLAWRRKRKVGNVDAMFSLAHAILPKMMPRHREQVADRFIELLKDVDSVDTYDIPYIAAVAREASSVGLITARKHIGQNQEGLLVLVARLKHDERSGLIASVLDRPHLPTSFHSYVAQCCEALPEDERKTFAKACLSRITGGSPGWSANRNSSLLRAELIEALAPQITFILGGETVPILRNVAEDLQSPPHRALALSTLAGCSSGDEALELATAALATYVSEDKEDEIFGWSHGTYDVRAALSILSMSDNAPKQFGRSESEAQNAAQLLQTFRAEQASSISSQLSRHWKDENHKAMQQLLETLCTPVDHKIGEFFKTFRCLTPVCSEWARRLWAQGMDAASAEGYRNLLYYMVHSAPGIDTVLSDDELRGVVDAVLNVPSWEWQ